MESMNENIVIAFYAINTFIGSIIGLNIEEIFKFIASILS